MAARLTFAEKGVFLAMAVLAVAAAVLLAEVAVVRPSPRNEMECNRPIRTESASIAISTVNPAASYYVLLPVPVSLNFQGEIHNSTRLARAISITSGEATFRTVEWEGVFLFTIVGKGNVSFGAEIRFDECYDQSYGEEAYIFSSMVVQARALNSQANASIRAFLASMGEGLEAIHVRLTLESVSIGTCSGYAGFEGDLTSRGQWSAVAGVSSIYCI